MTSSPDYLHGVIKREDGLYAYYFSSRVAYAFVRMIEPLPLRPNHISVMSLVLGLIAAALFANGRPRATLTAVVILNISFILDCADGQLARRKEIVSAMGHWCDYHGDKLKDGAVLFGIAVGVSVANPSVRGWVFLLAFWTIFFQFLRNITALNRDIFFLQHAGKKDTLHSPLRPRTGSQFLRSLRHSILFKLADRVALITIFAVANRLLFFLLLYCFVEFVYAMISAGLNYRTFARFDRSPSSFPSAPSAPIPAHREEQNH